jgi:fructosamine-3-kinase
VSGVPGAVLSEVQQHLEQLGVPDPMRCSVQPVGGGCISPSARLAAGGEPFFLKWSPDGETPADFFAAEARSLDALRASGALRSPAVRGVSERWLLLEWLEPSQPSASGWAELGRGLADLHAPPAAGFGWDVANYIGRLPQANEPAASWGAFWRERRLAPQLERAYRAGHFAAPERRRFERQLIRMELLLDAGDADGPSLLHGDLWSGNVHFAGGGPALIDPSSYHGHGEVDLAMAELFGGFAPAFFEAYTQARPLRPGYAELRRPLYQLYYLLVHVNLFGRGYVAGAVGALAAAERAI